MMTWFILFSVCILRPIRSTNYSQDRVDMWIDFPCGIFSPGKQVPHCTHWAQPCNYFSFCGGGDYVVNFFHFDPSRPAAILPPARRQRRHARSARAYSLGHSAVAVVALFLGFVLMIPLLNFRLGKESQIGPATLSVHCTVGRRLPQISITEYFFWTLFIH